MNQTSSDLKKVRRSINKWHLKERHKRLLRYLTVNNIENPLKFNYNKKPSHSFNDVYRTISDVCGLFTFLGWQSMRMVLFGDFLLTESCTTDLFITASVQRSPVSVSPTPALVVYRSHPQYCRRPSCPPKSSGHRHRVCLQSLSWKKQECQDGNSRQRVSSLPSAGNSSNSSSSSKRPKSTLSFAALSSFGGSSFLLLLDMSND